MFVCVQVFVCMHNWIYTYTWSISSPSLSKSIVLKDYWRNIAQNKCLAKNISLTQNVPSQPSGKSEKWGASGWSLLGAAVCKWVKAHVSWINHLIICSSTWVTVATTEFYRRRHMFGIPGLSGELNIPPLHSPVATVFHTKAALRKLLMVNLSLLNQGLNGKTSQPKLDFFLWTHSKKNENMKKIHIYWEPTIWPCNMKHRGTYGWIFFCTALLVHAISIIAPLLLRDKIASF